MQKAIIFLISIILFSCQRKPLYLSEKVKINICVTTRIDVNDFWVKHGKDDLMYNWDETLYGGIGYSEPLSQFEVIFLKGGVEIKRVYAYPNEKIPVYLESNTSYSVIIYNKTENTYESNLVLYSLKEKNPIDNEISQNYSTYKEPGEIFHRMIKNLYTGPNLNEYRIEYVDDVPIHVFDIDFQVVPISYIYIVQFVVLNDDNSEIEAKDISEFTVSSISTSKNLNTIETCCDVPSQVLGCDIKPGQFINSSIVFASRITLIGVSDKSNSSWDYADKNSYYTIINVRTHNYGTVSGVVDISDQLSSNPKGGIITIQIKNSELKNNSQESNGFGVSLKEWQENIQDIPF